MGILATTIGPHCELVVVLLLEYNQVHTSVITAEAGAVEVRSLGHCMEPDRASGGVRCVNRRRLGSAASSGLGPRCKRRPLRVLKVGRVPMDRSQ